MKTIKFHNTGAEPDITILASGDCCPTESMGAKLKKKNARFFGPSFFKLAAGSSLSILNLEAPLTRRRKGVLKCGPHIKVKPEMATRLKKAGFNLACLANNHIRDYGPAGVQDTFKTLNACSIKTFGVGQTPQSALTPQVIRRKGIRFAFLAFAENEFGGADNAGGWGAAPLNPVLNYETIRQTAKKNDVVIVLVHGGNEYCPFPSPATVELYRSWVRAGANAVIAGHTHVPQGYEIYRRVPIFYSLGNLYFPVKPNHQNPFWYRGYAVRLHFSANTLCCADIIPTLHDAASDQVDLMPQPEREQFHYYLDKLSDLLKKPARHRNLWECWCAQQNPHNWLDRVLSASWPATTDRTRQNLAALENRILCEAHRNLGKTFLALCRNGRLRQTRKHQNELKEYLQGYLPVNH